ncbi:MAG: CYTH domain-containing protein [Bacteroidota bacterium]
MEKINHEEVLTTNVSIEHFLDVYFDDDAFHLFQKDVGLRYRKRFLNNELIKVLVQLKTPLEEDGVARNEIKFDVKKSMNSNDYLTRHPLLRYIKKKNRDELDYYLRKYNTTSKDMVQSLSLTQTRKRLYISDSSSALATITLDFVRNNSFPFQCFTELELELNEIRYTDATESEKQSMELFNSLLKQALFENFPGLMQDQTPKYSKLKKIVDDSWVSFIYSNWMWIVWVGMGLVASIKMLS